MAANLGVTVVEVDGRSAPTIAAAPASVAGLLICSERGVPNRPVHVRGFADFTASFGGYLPGAFGAHAVRGFFDNGGSDAYVVRVAGRTGVAAAVDVQDRAGAVTLTVAAGRRGEADPGAWGNALSVDVLDHPGGAARIPAQLVGTKAEPFTVPVTTQVHFTSTTRGQPTQVDIEFAAGDFADPAAASGEEVAAAINRRTTLLWAAAVPGGRLLVAAGTDARAWTQLTVTGGSALGFADGASSDTAVAKDATAVAVSSASGFVTGSVVRLSSRGYAEATTAPHTTVTDGAGVAVTADGAAAPETILFHTADFPAPAAVTAADVAAAVNRQARTVTAEVTADNRLVLLSATDGASSSIALAAPAGPVPDARAELGFAAAVPVPGREIFRELTAASETYRALAWAQALPENPAGSGRAISAAAAAVRTVDFDLVVRRGGLEVERWESLSMRRDHPRYAPGVVNDQVAGSGHVYLRDHGNGSGIGLNVPLAGSFRLGTTASGDDGGSLTDIDFIGDPAERSGLQAFNDVPIQLLACPETTAAGVTGACMAYCERRGDAMFVGAVPRGYDLEGAKEYAAALRGRKVYGALYAPWIDVVNPVDITGSQPTVTIPPVGQVLGVYARIADTRGPWKAPAGDEARLVDALAVEYDLTDTDHTDLVRNGGVNGIRAIPGSGIVVDASRTLSTDQRWLYVNVRRLFNLVKSSLRDGLSFVAQEPNTEALRRSVKFNVVTPFLLGLWRQGAFGSDPPAQVFTVRCDTSNNPPADVALGIFTLEVFFYPTRPAESILVIVGQQDSGGATAADS